MCQGAITYTSPTNVTGNLVRARRPVIDFDVVEAQQVADEKKYGIRRSNPLESDAKYFKRVGEYRQRQVDQLNAQRLAIVAQQSSEMSRIKQEADSKRAADKQMVADLQKEQNERIAGIKAAGNAASGSLRVLGQAQPMAPTAQQTRRRSGRKGAGSTSAGFSRGSASTRGTNLSI